MTPGTALIIGAQSDMAHAVAHRFAAKGYAIQLAARDASALQIDQQDLKLRYNVPIYIHEFDVLETASHEALIAGLNCLPDIVICAVGLMGDQAVSERDSASASVVLRTNFEGPASVLSLFANCFEARGYGTIVGISSVAGERGRASNYVYGSAKAGFTAFLSGMRNRLAKKGVHVVTVLPGFVTTKMTEGMDLPKAVTAGPQEVAAAIERAVERKKNIIYVRTVWRVIMLIIRTIPESMFKRTQL